MATIDQLFPELKLTLNGDVLPTAGILPDALVLCETHTTCKCGCEYRQPNPVMLRYGRNMTRADEWRRKFNNIPREFVVHVETVSTCRSCFDDKTFTFEDF